MNLVGNKAPLNGAPETSKPGSGQRVTSQQQTPRNAELYMKNQYYCRDCYGWALQFTGASNSIQVESPADADKFSTEKEAQKAMIRAEEFSGSVCVDLYADLAAPQEAAR